MKEFAYRNHLRAMPSPRDREPIERIDSAPILLKLAECGDPRKIAAAHLQAIADRNEVIEELQDKLDAANEEKDEWRRRALAAEARLERPSFGAALWALAAMGWQSAWMWFETPESRAGIETQAVCGTQGEAT